MNRKHNVSDEEQLVTYEAATAAKEPLLSPQHAFVLQFYPETNVERKHFVGRVEHVVSGQAARFGSLDALMTFLERVLTEIRTAPLEQK